MIYCDNAATSFPKPAKVYLAARKYMTEICASPGRSSHSGSINANRLFFDTRELLAKLFHIPDSSRVTFALNATGAINQILSGILRKNDRVAVSSMEHNSVMRPLRHLEKERGITVSMVHCAKDGAFNLDAWDNALSGTRLAVVNHGSNVIGSLAPLRALGDLCRKHGVLFAVDAAQTAGICEIDVQAMNIGALAFSGHKGLFGLQGTGGMYLREGIACVPLILGGTGSNSESDEQPEFFPDCLESGTQNGPGIAALHAGISFVLKTGTRQIALRGQELSNQLVSGLRNISRINVHGPEGTSARLANVSITIDGMDSAEAALILDKKYDIAARVGLHCAPWAHRTTGTFPAGTIRLSPGYFTTEAEIALVLAALQKIAT